MLKLENISHSYKNQTIISNLNIVIKNNAFLVITGKSGSGKTTLLDIIGLLIKPQNGRIFIDEKEQSSKSEVLLSRRYRLGYIFQNYALLPEETVKNNLMLAVKYNHDFQKSDLEMVLNKVGLSQDYLKKEVHLLSGGEQQRVAIARVLLKPCDIILADEPTGNLDSENANLIMQLLKEINVHGKTIICATHDMNFLKFATQRINLDEI